MPMPMPAPMSVPGLMLGLLCIVMAAGNTAVSAAAAAATEQTVEELRLETSDGIRIAAWHYPAPKEAKAVATVILIHDLEGSHKTVDHFARSLQRAGCAVVAPDLRGHGGSGVRPATLASSDKDDKAQPRLLKKIDFESMAAATGGRLREQSGMRGEIEAVRNWIKQQSDAGSLDIDRLCVVGCGLGATLASMWTAADSNWPPTTTGPQGRQVRALALVSPVWATKGISMSVPFTSGALQREIPIMVFAGKADRDAIRLFDQLKRFRPAAWFQQRPGQPPDKARDLEDPADATVFFMQIDTSLTGDKLANDPALHAADHIKTFFTLALARKPD